MDILIRLVVAVLVGLIAQWLLALLLPAEIATLGAILIAVLVFSQGVRLRG